MEPLNELMRKIRETEKALARTQSILDQDADLQAAQINRESLQKRHSRLLEELAQLEGEQKRRQA